MTTKALAVVEQTDLARLIQQREELSASKAGLLRHLKSLRPFSGTAEAAAYEAERKQKRTTLKALQVSWEEHSADEAERQRLMDLVTRTKVRDLLEQSDRDYYHRSFRYWIDDSAKDIEEHVEWLRQAPPEIIDPHIEVTNNLATVEAALKATKDAIKVLIP